MSELEGYTLSPQADALNQQMLTWPTQPLDYGAITACATKLCSLDSSVERRQLLPLFLRNIGKFDLENDPRVRVRLRTVDYPGITLLFLEYPTDPSHTGGPETTICGFDLTNRIKTINSKDSYNNWINPLLERTTLSTQKFGNFLRGLDEAARQTVLDTFPEGVRNKVAILFDIASHPQTVVLNNVAISSKVKAALPHDRLLTPEELLKQSIADNENIVLSGFDPRAINLLNTAFFSRPDAFEHGIANFYIATEAVQQALARLIDRLTLGKQAITIKELATGAKLRYPVLLRHLSNGATAKVILSDFPGAKMPNNADLIALGLDPIQFTREAYDLLQPFPLLADDQRVDIMLTTYGFDSVWSSEDRRYIKQDGRWYKSSYRLRVPANIEASQREELLEVLRGDKTANELDINLLNSVEIEELMEQVDLTDPINEPLGAYVLQRYDALDSARVNLPGGLISKVSEAFATQIQPGGAFIIGDVAINDATLHPENSNNPINPFEVSGLVEKFKIEDYGITQTILQSMGYEVEMINARVLMYPFLTDELRRNAAERVLDHWIMIVRKDTARR